MGRRDESIKKDIIEQLNGDSRIDASGMDVRVDKGVVTLSGTVPDLMTRQRAAIEASLITGVASVKNHLNVQYVVAMVDDKELGSRIKYLLDWSSGIDATGVNVAVSAGRVFLEGSVATFMEKMQAEELASNVSGTLEVTNEIAVTPAKSHFDETIGEKVVQSIARNTNMDMNLIDVKVQSGIVTLSGAVPSGMSLHAVCAAAQVVPGVVDVINNLVVQTD